MALYSDTAENEAALYHPTDDTLIVSMNGHRNHLSDCIVHSDYNLRKMIRHFKEEAKTPWKKQPVLTFRDYRKDYPDYVLDCTQYDFTGSTIVTTLLFFVTNDIHNILLYVPNNVHGDNFINDIRTRINIIKECHPNCNIYKISKDGNFDLDVISVKDFYGIHC